MFIIYVTGSYAISAIVQFPRQFCNCRPFANSLGNSTMHNCLGKLPNLGTAKLLFFKENMEFLSFSVVILFFAIFFFQYILTEWNLYSVVV
jgi:hypothetical protein